MPTINKSKVVTYSAAQMYALVNAVEDYPQFVPACHASECERINEDELHATLHFEKGGFSKSFSTHNRLQKDKMVEMKLLDGPFSHLHGFWRFEPLDDGGSKVLLDLEFEFSNMLLAMAIGAMFEQIVGSLVDAFCQRAVEVYSAG